MNAEELADSARRLVAGDKGLLAMDESTPTCNGRFATFRSCLLDRNWAQFSGAGSRGR
jgi:hypothetical protein